MCVPLLNAIRVPRIGAGRPRTTPEAVLGDKAYSSRAILTELRRRGIVSVIPEPRDQQATANAAARRAGVPVSYDVEVYKGRNVVERFLNYLKQWRGLATRYDKYAHIYRGGVTLGAILCWLSSQR
jgi:transposase